jgi:hypothetical protein
MNIIKTGEYYRIFGNGVQVGKVLSPAMYEVVFVKNDGFYLRATPNPVVQIGKVYGRMTERIEKVLKSYALSQRNLGVILSGAKGIGKSLFAKLISLRAIDEGLPVIMVNQYYEGLPQFLASIEQRCMVLFDEFDKNFFDPSRETEDHTAVQDSFLTLFDGVYASNKLFVITANSLGRLSEFLINRPGRFRYHLRFTYPDEAEIRQFLKDQLGEAANPEEVDNVVKFSTMVPLSYDCLTAIASELALGESFDACLEVLNILNVTGYHYYSARVRFASGEELQQRWVGQHNFFDKSRDAMYLNIDLEGISGTQEVELGTLLMKCGDVRKCGTFLQDGSIVIPYENGRNFRWVQKSSKGRQLDERYKTPIELILESGSGHRQVSFKDLF